MPKLISEILRYTTVSALALAVDFCILLKLAEYMHYLAAATFAFLCGCTSHYLLSIRFVFRVRRLRENKHAEQVLYVAAGIAGLAVNWIVISAAVEFLSLSLATGKMIASGISFLTGYLIRKVFLFSEKPAPPPSFD